MVAPIFQNISRSLIFAVREESAKIRRYTIVTDLPSKGVSCEEGGQQLDGVLPDGTALVPQPPHHQLQEGALSGQGDRLGGGGGGGRVGGGEWGRARDSISGDDGWLAGWLTLALQSCSQICSVLLRTKAITSYKCS